MWFWKYWLMPNSDQRPAKATKVLFIQGGGAEAHDWDARLASSLEKKLGPGYQMIYPLMPNEADPNYRSWKRVILKELKAAGAGAVLVGHSIGASMLMKMLPEGAGVSLKGVFLVAAPYMHEREGWQWAEAALPAKARPRPSSMERLPRCATSGGMSAARVRVMKSAT